MFVLYLAKYSGERLQDHWSSGLCLAWSDRFSRKEPHMTRYFYAETK